MNNSADSEDRFPMFDILRLALATVVVVCHTVWKHQLVPAVPGFLAISGHLVLASYLKDGIMGPILMEKSLPSHSRIPGIIGPCVRIVRYWRALE